LGGARQHQAALHRPEIRLWIKTDHIVIFAPIMLLDAQLAAIEAMSLEDLRVAWRKAHDTPPPKLSRAMLLLALGHALQCRALGGKALSGKAAVRNQSLLRTVLEVSNQPRMSPGRNLRGARLIRSWQGKSYVVEVGEDGVVRWNNRSWPSLSAVACAVTGTHWSGPAFFGLRAKEGVKHGDNLYRSIDRATDRTIGTTL
jgi:Protein of unknown function (DUF2924)